MRERLRLLVVDDEVENCAVIARVFRSKFDVVEACDGEEAVELAAEMHPDVVISDQRMPGMTGVELLTRIKSEFPNAIRILATGYAEYGALVDAVNSASVHHYVEKPFHTLGLKSMVDALVDKQALERERQQLVDELRASEQQLQGLVSARTAELERAMARLEDKNRELSDMVVRDGLTGVHNHRYLREYLEIEVARSSRYRREFGVLFLDIDNFKSINDRFGHLVGDAVLCRVAQLLQPAHHRMRQSDFAARYGGEEFVVVLPETEHLGASIKAERIRKAAEDLQWSDIAAGLGPVTLSIGVAAYPDHGTTADRLLKAADDALYKAKTAGKNRVESAGE